MKKRIIVLLGLTGVLIFSACSGGSVETNKQPKIAATSGNGNSAPVSNGAEVAPPQALAANAVNATSGSPIMAATNSVQRKLEEMRKADSSGPKIDPAALALKNAKPAPDNSTFASYLGDEGYEIRTFKNHPQLLKVEKKTTAAGEQTLKVFLRGGRVVEMPGHKINPLSIAPASMILTIAGVQTEPVRTVPGAPVESKKQQD